MDVQPSGRRKTWCQETLCHLSQGTGWYLASWSCLCSAVLRHGGGGCLSTTLHRHDQLANYHQVWCLLASNLPPSWALSIHFPGNLTCLQLVGTMGETLFQEFDPRYFDKSSASGYMGQHILRNLVHYLLTCPQLLGTWVQNMFRNSGPDVLAWLTK